MIYHEEFIDLRNNVNKFKSLIKIKKNNIKDYYVL